MNKSNFSRLSKTPTVWIPLTVERDSDLEGSLNSASSVPQRIGLKPLKPTDLINLQQTIGNQAVMRLIGANNKRFPVASQRQSGLPAPSSKVQSMIQRLPSKIEPSGLVNYQQFSGNTNTNAVFMLEFNDGNKIVIKYQSARATTGEILAGKILEDQKIEGINVPKYRILDDVEVKGIISELTNLAKLKKDEKALGEIRTRMFVDTFNSKPSDKTMLAMDLMENAGMLPEEKKNQIYAEKGKLTPEGLIRLRNIGKLYAFQYFIKGSDRFLTPHSALGKTQGGNKANILMSGKTNHIQAVDTTLDMNVHETGGGSEKKKAYLSTLGDHMDEFIFNPGGTDKLTQSLESFLGIKEMDDTGRQALRAGFLEALKLLSKSNTDIDNLVGETLKLLPKDSNTGFSEESVRSSFTELLSDTRKMFSEKAEVFEKVDNLRQTETGGFSKEIPNILRIASRIRVNGNLEQADFEFLKKLSRTPNNKEKKRKKKWPLQLTALENTKNGLKKGKKVLAGLITEIMSKIVNFGQSQLELKDNNVSSDFLRVCSKLILRTLGVKY